MRERPYAARARELCTEDHATVWFCATCRMLEQRLTPVSDLLRDLLDEVAPPLALTLESPYTLAGISMYLPHPKLDLRRSSSTAVARRKWIVRRHRDASGDLSTGWVITAPAGARRWFADWQSLRALSPYFVMGEQSPMLRELMPTVFDAGVRV